MADRLTLSSWGVIPVAALVILVLAGLAVPVSAMNLSVSEYHGNVPAGGTIKYAVLASNSWDDEPVDLLVDVNGISQKADLQYGPVDPIKDTYTYSARKFTSVDESRVHVDRGGKKQIILAFSFPADVGDGGRYATVVIHTLPGKNVTAADTTIPVFLTIIGSDLTIRGSITSLTAEDVAAGQPVTVTTGYKNTGKIHQENVVNTVTVSAENGNAVATNTTRLPGNALLPDKTYAFTARPDIRNLPAGTYTILSRVTAEKELADKKTVTFTISPAPGSANPVPATSFTTAPVPTTTAKSPLPPVLCLAALAGALVALSLRERR